MAKRTRVVAFGTFDLLHPGHLAFLRQARRHGDELVVVVTRDARYQREKGRRPRIPDRDRARLVAALRVVDRAVLGDSLSRRGGILRKLRPQVIVVGYDQPCDIPAFRASLRALGLHVRVVRLRAYQGRRYHSRRLAPES